MEYRSKVCCTWYDHKVILYRTADDADDNNNDIITSSYQHNYSVIMNSNITDWVAMIRIDAWYVDRIIGYIL